MFKASPTPTTPVAVMLTAHLSAEDSAVPVAPAGGVTPRRTPRRRFPVEAGATLAASLGVTAAVLAPDPTWGAPAASAEPDAELIAAGDGSIRATDPCDSEGSNLEPEGNPPGAELEGG